MPYRVHRSIWPQIVSLSLSLMQWQIADTVRKTIYTETLQIDQSLSHLSLQLPYVAIHLRRQIWIFQMNFLDK